MNAGRPGIKGSSSIGSHALGTVDAEGSLRAEQRLDANGMEGVRTRVLACLGGMATMGGRERTIVEVLRSVAGRGAPVHCILSSWAPEQLVAAVEAAGATWSTGRYREPLQRRPTILDGVRIAVDVFRTSGGLMRDAIGFRPTCLLLPDFGVLLRNWPALAILRLLGVPAVLAARNAPGEGRFHSRVWRWLVRPLATKVVCASEATRRAVTAHGIPAARTLVIGSVVPLMSASAGEDRDLQKVIYVGQLIPEKGLDLLLEAIAIVRRRGMPATLDVIGQTEGWVAPAYDGYRERMFARARRADLDGAIRFLGWRDDVPALLATAGVHCIPSRPEMYEGLPRVVIEAKVAGTPSVAFAHGPFPELIDHGRNGWLVNDVDASSLAAQLDTLLREPETLCGMSQAVRDSGRRFDPEASQHDWWRVLSSQRAGRIPLLPRFGGAGE